MPVRLLVSIAILIAAFLVMFLVLIATETALSVWHYLRQAPLWVQVGYGLILVGLPLATLAVFWAWFRPARKNPRKPSARKRLTADELEGELLESAQAPAGSRSGATSGRTRRPLRSGAVRQLEV